MLRCIKFFFIFSVFFSFTHLIAQENRILSLQSQLDIKWKEAKRIKLLYLVANDIENIQKVIEMRFSITPDTIYEKDGNKYAEFVMEGSNKQNKLEIKTLLEVYQHDLRTLKKNKTPITHLTSPEKYLISEQYMETDDETIQEKALELRKKESLKTVESIYKFVRKTMKPGEYNPNDVGAKQALIDKKGDCTEYTDLFVALCRACSIPAKHILGYISGSVNIPQHSWAEVFIDDLGWIQIELMPDNETKLAEINRGYILMTETRNDRNLDYGYYYLCHWWGDSSPTIKDTISIKEYARR
ncbi:MAG: transglutaminase-like domain-containing protein [Dysgonomonas sp.]